MLRTRRIRKDDPSYIEEQVRKRFRHLNLEEPVTKALFEETLRRHLGKERDAQ